MNNRLWLVPAGLALAFFSYSLWCIVTAGPLGFVVEHTRNRWSAQIGLDLVNSAVLCLFMAAPLARRYGIRMLPWVVLTLATGSIALFALAARILYARSKTADRG